VSVGDGLGLGDGLGEGLGLGDGLGLADGLGLGDGEGLGVGLGSTVVGCQDAFMSEPAEGAKDAAVPIDGLRIRSSKALEPPRSVASTIRVPSGDHDGVYTNVAGEYTATAPEPSAFDVYTWV
jgi:hypothetical protein